MQNYLLIILINVNYYLIFSLIELLLLDNLHILYLVDLIYFYILQNISIILETWRKDNKLDLFFDIKKINLVNYYQYLLRLFPKLIEYILFHCHKNFHLCTCTFVLIYDYNLNIAYINIDLFQE